ncbi:SDR family oxidoreductase [Paenibacillus sp. MMS20-IR301]|uniref:SDR family oxidoreductase n=1 Tax=Paenibacillus sp. MMS20-IR301 TaxID=2895946 RepID=UPI0028E7E7C2|nr:SDR family oxidoreductase [Paenibacillus sp. MMS20-IR301]WNS42397.1 SDR family oxidoreductase [Paenibacillus sp. MMS20-IR301]
MKIALTGATGQFGSIVAEVLLKTVPAGNLVASVRQPEKAAELQARGVDVRHGDFDQPETLDAAFAGVDRLLIVSADGDNETRVRQHKAAVDAAVRAGVGYIVYTSVADAENSSLFLAPVHRATEEFIRESGIPYAFLRNNWYLENEAGSIQAVKAGAPWLTSAGEGKVGWATRRDYAEAAAVVLAGDGKDSVIYELSGTPATQAELAAVTGGVLGQEVAVQQVDDAAYASIMAGAGVPEAALPIVVAIQGAIRDGALDIKSDDLQKLLNRPLTPLSEGVSQLLG